MIYVMFILYTEVIIPTVSEDHFSLSNTVGPDAMPRHVAFHLGLHCLRKYLFRGWSNDVINDPCADIESFVRGGPTSF